MSATEIPPVNAAGGAEIPCGEYLGADETGCEYFTRGGHIYRIPHEEGGPEQRGAPCPRGRFASFNRINRRHRRAGFAHVA